MPNQLSIPFKKTYPASIRDSVKKYLLDNLNVHPDGFKWDISRWEALRKTGVGGVVHVDRIAPSLNYHAQLVAILAKLPLDINLEIAYAPAFSPSAVPVTLSNLAFERAAMLFNLSALYSQLASSEDRSKQDGVKRATLYYQAAAGVLSYMIAAAIPGLSSSVGVEDRPLDLSVPLLRGLELLMLAQAQECAWQRAVMDGLKNGLLAKLSTKVASLYASSSASFKTASPSVKHLLPSDWLPHIDAKQYHFDAAAQYRKSAEELDSNRYGIELARLDLGRTSAKRAYDLARKGGVAPAVLSDVKSLLDKLEENYSRSEKDNDLIYHQDVPSSSTLPPIPDASVVESKTPAELLDLKRALGDESSILAGLTGWGATEAIKIYNDNKASLVAESIVQPAKDLDHRSGETLRSLNLPSALEALERPVGLPPSLLKKAEEVRLEQGPDRIAQSLEDIDVLAARDLSILEEAMDILDNEVSEDEAARKIAPIQRPTSIEANVELIEQQKRYRDILGRAAESDETVRKKWDEWADNIDELTWDEASLEASVPSSTTRTASKNGVTQTHARALRVLLESLDDHLRARAQLVDRAQRLLNADDIQARIQTAAAGCERWAQVQPEMFQDTMDEELSKYDKFISGIAESEEKQDETLASIRRRNEQFLESRKEDSSVKEREHALQSLDLAYHKYREITRNLDEGLKFYNDLAVIFVQFKEACKGWSTQRKQQLRSLRTNGISKKMEAMSIGEAVASNLPSSPTVNRPAATPARKVFAMSEDDWDEDPMDVLGRPGKEGK